MVMEVKKREEKVDAAVPASGAVVSVSSPVSDISIEMKETATPAPPAGRKTGPARRSAKGGWTEDEDELLRQAVSKFNGKNWKKIAEFFPNRSDVQCLHRWQKVLDPKLVKGPWTKEEDDRIIDLVKKYGTQRWSFIAKSLEGRIGKQCRERWHNQLDPQNKKEAWTPEEEAVLIEAHEIYGNKWAEIAKKLPGRADNAIKNHWNCSVKKRLPTYSSFVAPVQEDGAPVTDTKFVASREIFPVRKNHRNSSVKKRLPRYSSSGIPTEQHGAPVADTKILASQEVRPTSYSSTHQHGVPVANTKFFDRQGIFPAPCSSFLIPTQQHGAPVADTKTFVSQEICPTAYPMTKRIRSPALPDIELAGDDELLTTSNKDLVYRSHTPGKLNLELQLCTLGDAKCQETNRPTWTVPELAGDANLRTSHINLFRQGRPIVDSLRVRPEYSKCQKTNQPASTLPELAGDGLRRTTSSIDLIHQSATQGRLNMDSQLVRPEHSKCQEMNRPTPTLPELAGDGHRRTTSSIDLIHQSANKGRPNVDSQLVRPEHSSIDLIHQSATKGRPNVDSQLVRPEHSKCQETNRPTPTVPEFAGDGHHRTTSSIDLLRQSATEESLNTMDSQLVQSEHPKCEEVNNQPSSNCIGGNMKQIISLESRHCLPIKKRYIGSPSRSGLVRSNLGDENKSLNSTEATLSNLPEGEPSHTDKVDDPAPTTPGNSGSQLQLKDKQCSISDKHISRSEAYVSTPSDWGSPSPIAILRTLGKGFETPSIIRKRAYRSSGPVSTVSGRDSSVDGDSSVNAKRVRNYSESEYAHKNRSSDLNGTDSLNDDRFFRFSHERTTKSLVRKLADEFGTGLADSLS